MIKINLVSEGRRPVVARKAKEALGIGKIPLVELALYLVLLVGILGIFGYWWYLRGEVKQRETEIAAAQKEVDALAAVLKEVEEFKAKKAELEHKIQVINDLKRQQWGPVRIMDQVSRALPDLLWLDRLNLRGNRVEIRGQAFNTNQIASFIGNLDRVPEFQEPRLVETRKGNDAYSFTLNFNFSPVLPNAEAAGEEAEADPAEQGAAVGG